MSVPTPPKRVSHFEAIKHEDDDGEYWSARELAKTLEYTQWRNFVEVINKAKIACDMSGQQVSYHFADISKMITIGKGGQRKVEDVHLSRLACYLIVQNADPSKRIVALGQTYFAVQTRRMEQRDALADLPDLSEDQRRLLLRDQIADLNGQLAEAAETAGVVAQEDFAIFQDHGYRGLYGGETMRAIAKRKALKRNDHILDHMGSEELADNIFRIVHTEARLRRDAITTKEDANTAHYEIGRVVRRAIEEMDGTLPETLPPPDKSIQQVRREEARRQQIASEDRIGLWARIEAGDGDVD